MTIMAIDKSGENIPNDSEAYYEKLASQEEIYLEETEEKVHAILDSYHSTPSPEETERSMCAAKDDPHRAESLDEQLDHAAEELITGDSDDPPLREEVVAEMLRMTQMPKVSRPDHD